MTGDEELRDHIREHVYAPFIEPVLVWVANRVVRWFI